MTSSFSGQFRRYLEGGIFGKLMLAILVMVPVSLGLTAFFGGSEAVVSGLLIGLVLGIVILGAWLAVNYARGFAQDSVIARERIEKFKAVEGTQGLTRPRFIVKFRKNGEIRNRYILMPSKMLSYGREEFEEAKEKLREEGFEVEVSE